MRRRDFIAALGSKIDLVACRASAAANHAGDWISPQYFAGAIHKCLGGSFPPED